MGAARNRGSKADRIAQAQARVAAEREAERIERERVAQERQAILDAMPEDQRRMVVRDLEKRRKRIADNRMLMGALAGLTAGAILPR